MAHSLDTTNPSLQIVGAYNPIINHEEEVFAPPRLIFRATASQTHIYYIDELYPVYQLTVPEPHASGQVYEEITFDTWTVRRAGLANSKTHRWGCLIRVYWAVFTRRR